MTTERVIVRRDTSVSVVNERSPIRVVVGGQGPSGAQGFASGVVLAFDDATGDADPGNGQWRANSATFLNITKLWLDNTQAGDGASITTWIDALDGGGSVSHRGILRAQRANDPSQWVEFDLTDSVVDKTGYRELTVAPRAEANWIFDAADDIVFTFYQTGIQDNKSAIEFVFSGHDLLLTADAEFETIEVPFACIVTAGRLMADAVGSAVVDIWKVPFASYPPTIADSIVGAAPLTLSSERSSEDTTMTGWTTHCDDGDILAFKINSISGLKRLTVSLRTTKDL